MAVQVDPEALWDQGRIVERLSYDVVGAPLTRADACGSAVAAEAIAQFVAVLGLGVMAVEQGIGSCGLAAKNAAQVLGVADDAARDAWSRPPGFAALRV